MLITSRKINQVVTIGGIVDVKVIRINGGVIKLGFDAPVHIGIYRDDLLDKEAKKNRVDFNSQINPSEWEKYQKNISIV